MGITYKNNLALVLAKLELARDKGVKDGSVEIVNLSQAECPVLTGFLRSTIGYEIKSDKSSTIEAKADYAVYVHEGTQNMPARRFLLNPVVANEENLKTIISKPFKQTRW